MSSQQEPVPQPPPKPLTATWLTAYGRFEGPKPVAVREERLPREDADEDWAPSEATTQGNVDNTLMPKGWAALPYPRSRRATGSSAVLKVTPEGGGAEQTYTVRRLGPFVGPYGSGVPATELRLLEREFRFYTELAAAALTPAWLVPPEQLTVLEECSAAVATAAGRGEEAVDLKMQNTFRTTAGFAATLRPPKEEWEDDWVRDAEGPPPPQSGDEWLGDALIKSSNAEVRRAQDVEGLLGDYEVVYRRVSTRTQPHASSLPTGVVQMGDQLRAHCVDIQGEEWLRIDDETMKRLSIRGTRAFVPLKGTRFGLGDRLLFKRKAGTVRPGPESWVNIDVLDWVKNGCGTVSDPLTNTLRDKRRPIVELQDRWADIARRLLSRSLRVPLCYAAYWAGDLMGYALVTERLAPPLWRRPSVVDGCTPEQANALFCALARLHAGYRDCGRLATVSNTWLPIMPYDMERHPGWLWDQYSSCFEKLKKSLEWALPERAFLAVDKLRECPEEVLIPLTKPPLTIIHGDLRLDCLRFTFGNSDASRRFPSVAADDWRFVCQGRGGFDLASVLLCVDPATRRAGELEWMEGYLHIIKKMEKNSKNPHCFFPADDEVRTMLEDEVRAALLFIFAMHIIRNVGSLEVSPKHADGITEDAFKSSWRLVQWLGEAMEDWDSARVVGEEPVEKQKAKKKLKRGHIALKKSKPKLSEEEGSRDSSPKAGRGRSGTPSRGRSGSPKKAAKSGASPSRKGTKKISQKEDGNSNSNEGSAQKKAGKSKTGKKTVKSKG